MTDNRCRIPLHYSHAHSDTHIYIDYYSLQPVEWSKSEVGERGRRYMHIRTHTLGNGGSVCKHLSPADIETCTGTHVTQIRLKAIQPACCRLALCVTWEEQQ